MEMRWIWSDLNSHSGANSADQSASARRVSTLSVEDFAQTLPADQGEMVFESPEQESARQELRLLLEGAIDSLATPFRAVFVMRVIEGMSIDETASCLGIHSVTVRTRLYRASRQLKSVLGGKLAGGFADVFPFGGARCDRLAHAVLARLGCTPPAGNRPPRH
jgi:RNA polymerase sigma-70 factor (ECF subfamily)